GSGLRFQALLTSIASSTATLSRPTLQAIPLTHPWLVVSPTADWTRRGDDTGCIARCGRRLIVRFANIRARPAIRLWRTFPHPLDRTFSRPNIGRRPHRSDACLSTVGRVLAVPVVDSGDRYRCGLFHDRAQSDRAVA